MKYIIDTNNFPLSDYTKWVHDNATPLTDCDNAISRSAVMELIMADWEYEGLEEPVLSLPSVNPTRPKTDAIPIEWLKEKLVNHPELSYSLTDGIINVLNFWESEKESRYE